MSKVVKINFFKEGIRFRLNHQERLRLWFLSTAKKEGNKIQSLNFIFCNDKYLLRMNKKYLNHNYFTDIITFNNSEGGNGLEGDIFISIDTVRKNSHRYQTGFEHELHRVMVHGLLHLCGYNDVTENDRKKMKEMEDVHLRSFHR